VDVSAAGKWTGRVCDELDRPYQLKHVVACEKDVLCFEIPVQDASLV
jgi:hypothetical protein